MRSRIVAIAVSAAGSSLAMAMMMTAPSAAAAPWCGRNGNSLPQTLQQAMPQSLQHAMPQSLQQATPGFDLRGEGELRWFGLLAYRARLWMPRGGAAAATGPLALEIQYARRFRGEQLASRSVDEMRHTGAGSDAQRQAWGGVMASTFRDVDAGDCILGIMLGDGSAQFFHNGTPLGTIGDREFGRAFFGIWLSPGTSQPALRAQLLGAGP